jgi:acyl-CoA synthetase (AMP-forming)/AMP-acid ligase II
MNIGNLLSRNARYNPDKPALIFENQCYTFRQFNQNVNQLANALQDMGIGKGDKLATLLPNGVELLEIY